MRISDWSSDVCASDLPRRRGVREARRERAAETVEGGDDLEHALFAHRRHFRPVRVAVGRAQVVHARPLPGRGVRRRGAAAPRSEEHTSELQSLMRNSYAVICLKKKTRQNKTQP